MSIFLICIMQFKAIINLMSIQNSFLSLLLYLRNSLSTYFVSTSDSIDGLKGTGIFFCSSSSQSISEKKGCYLISLMPFGPLPSLFFGFLAINCFTIYFALLENFFGKLN